MSKYTIELRTVVNHTDIFNNLDFPFYTDNIELKEKFKKQFIEYYYYDEIGFSTIDKFVSRFHNLLHIKMDYYKQLYETELRSKDIDFMLNKDLEESYEKEINSNSESSNTTSNTSNINSITTSENKSLTTPNQQYTLNNNYVDGINKSDVNNNSTGTNKVNSQNVAKGNGKEITKLVSKGNIGITSSAELLEKWRNVIININEQIINDCSILFMGVY